jgi:cytochrome c-type protein NapB
MSRPGPRDAPGFTRLDIVRAVSVMAVVVLVVGAALERDRGGLRYPPPGPLDVGGPPIGAEAGVFSIEPGDLAVALDFEVERPAHSRNLEFTRRLRAYPGAPPRIPHGLTLEEYGEVRCAICHERGGWVARFNTYAPVTPHPEQTDCFQCHLPLDELVGRPLPPPGSLVCTQCHVDPDSRPQVFVALDWKPMEWPPTELQPLPGSPNLIPHDVVSRNNCLACHGAPGSVDELRSDHPDRWNCRQCHVPASAEPEFMRALPPDAGSLADGDRQPGEGS